MLLSRICVPIETASSYKKINFVNHVYKSNFHFLIFKYKYALFFLRYLWLEMKEKCKKNMKQKREYFFPRILKSKMTLIRDEIENPL